MRRLLAACTAVVIAVACASDSTTATETTAATGSVAASTDDARPGTVPTVDGGRFDLSMLAGRSALLWFWAPY